MALLQNIFSEIGNTCTGKKIYSKVCGVLKAEILSNENPIKLSVIRFDFTVVFEITKLNNNIIFFLNMCSDAMGRM